MSPDTIRHYERIGILPKAERTAAGYRVYHESATERVRVVQNALHVGFTLSELADVFKTLDAGGTPCRRVYELAQDKLKRIKSDIESLKHTEAHLQALLSDWEERLRRASDGQKSLLLHSMPSAVMEIGPQTSKFRKRKTL